MTGFNSDSNDTEPEGDRAAMIVAVFFAILLIVSLLLVFCPDKLQ